MTVELVDVSAMQGIDVPWGQLRDEGIEAVIVKASEGVDYIDPHFYTHVMRATQAGLFVMAYHYLRVRSGKPQDARTQANQFCKAVQAAGLPVLSWLDCETAENASAQPAEWAAAIRAFNIEHKVQMGVANGIYTSPGEWMSMGGVILATAIDFTACPLWVAQYGGDHPKVPSPWTDWTLWQYTGSGHVAGLTFDRSTYRGSLEELKALAGE